MSSPSWKAMLCTAAIATVTAAAWNFVPMWLVRESLSEPMKALWTWGIFPMSIPIFYAFFDRYLRRP